MAEIQSLTKLQYLRELDIRNNPIVSMDIVTLLGVLVLDNKNERRGSKIIN